MKDILTFVRIRSVCLFLAISVAACAPVTSPQGSNPLGGGTAELATTSDVFVLPTLVSPGTNLPFPTADGSTQIAVISILVSDTYQLDPQRSYIVNGYASKGLNLATGPLTIELVAKDGSLVNLSTQDPRSVHVYDSTNNEKAHSVSFNEPPILIDHRPFQWTLTLPILARYRDLQINRINILDEKNNLIFVAGLNLEENKIEPFPFVTPRVGSFSQPGEMFTVENNVTVEIDPFSLTDKLKITVGDEEQPMITVDSGQISINAPNELKRIGFSVDETNANVSASPLVELLINGQTYSYSVDELSALSGQTLELGRNKVLVTMADSVKGIALDITNLSGTPIEEVKVSGENFQLSNVAVQTGQ